MVGRRIWKKILNVSLIAVLFISGAESALAGGQGAENGQGEKEGLLYNVKSININDVPKLTEGETYRLDPVAVHPNGQELENIKFAFASNTPEVAFVDHNGVITALSAGEASITVETTNALRNISNLVSFEVEAKEVEDIPDIIFTDNGSYVTLENPEVTIEITKSGASIRSIKYKDDDRNLIGNTSGGYSFQNFFDGQSGREWWVGDLQYRIVEETDSMVRLAFEASNPERFPWHFEIHMTFRGDIPGVYVHTIFRAKEWMPEGASIGQSRYAMRVDPNIFTYYAVDDERKGDLGEFTQYIETMHDATWRQEDGHIYTKYQKITNLEGDDNVFGLFGDDIGVSFIQPNKEHFVGGPTKQELTLHRGGPILLWHEHAGHYGSPGPRPYVGWEKIYGPLLIYVNSGEGMEEMWEDAKQKAAEEVVKWPYQWLDDPLYQANDRIDVSGTLNITDGSTPEDAWVILGPQGIDWQLQNLEYLYYTRADKDGNFTIPATRPGEYTLFAHVDGVFGELQIDGVKVEGHRMMTLGIIDWTPAKYGETLWQIGTPNRSAEEFYISPGIARTPVSSDRFREFGTWLYYPLDFPNGVDFKVGESDEATDWNYFHPMRRTPGNPNHFRYAGNYELDNSPEIWQIRFDSDGELTGTGTMLIGIASSVYGSLQVKLNGTVIGDYPQIPGPTIDNALYRQAVRGIYRQLEIPFDASLVRNGENIVTLSPSQIQDDNFWVNMFANVMYDVIRLDIDQDKAFGEVASVDIPEQTQLRLGDTYQLEPRAIDTEGNEMKSILFTYRSDRPDVASVDQYGLITVKDWGRAEITVSTLGAVKNKSAEMIVIVATDPVDYITLDEPNTIKFGESVQLRPVGRDPQGNPVENVVFAYESSDPSVVNVNRSGVITGLAPGTTEITVKTDNTLEVSEYTFTVEVERGPLNDVNEASSEHFRETLENPELGLNLGYYNNLSEEQKDWVAQKVYEFREESGIFLSVAQLQEVIDHFILNSGYYNITNAELLDMSEDLQGTTPIQSTMDVTRWIQQEHLGDQTASFYLQMLTQTVGNNRVDARDHQDHDRRPQLKLTVDGEVITLLPTDNLSVMRDGNYRRATPLVVSIDWADSYLKYDLSGITGIIEAAELVLTTYGRTDAAEGNLGVHAMVNDNWFQHSQFDWDRRPIIIED